MDFVLQDYQSPLFGNYLIPGKEEDLQVSQALCLPVSVAELLQNNNLAGVSTCFILKTICLHEFLVSKMISYRYMTAQNYAS